MTAHRKNQLAFMKPSRGVIFPKLDYASEYVKLHVYHKRVFALGVTQWTYETLRSPFVLVSKFLCFLNRET